MKKNIEYASINASLLQWLTRQLQSAPDELNGVKELQGGLSELQNGCCSSLILEVSDGEASADYADRIICAGLEIVPRFRRVTLDGKELSLTPKEYDILYFLAANRGIIYTKEQIYRAVWGDEYLIDDSNIMAFIRKLRKKIEPNPDAPRYILTVWGIGYKFSDQ